MFLQGPLLLVLSSVLVVSTTPFPSAEASASKLSATLDITTPLHPSNASFSSLDTTAENSLTIHCDGGTYGYNPSIPDCESLSQHLTPDDNIWTFKQRSMDFPPDTVYLPFLVMGDQALCYTQTVLLGDNLSAKASKTMLVHAVAALVRQCAKGATSQGGIATNIGKTVAKFIIISYFSDFQTDLHLLAATPRRRQSTRRSTRDISPETHLQRRRRLMGVMQAHSIHNARRRKGRHIRPRSHPFRHPIPYAIR